MQPRPLADLTDRQPLDAVHAPDLRPLLHADHALLLARSPDQARVRTRPDEPDPAPGGSLFDRRRWVSIQAAPTSRQAALDLHTEPDLEDLPLGVLLLTDIRGIFDRHETWTLSSDELCNYLNLLHESPWGNFSSHGVKTGITVRSLARLLRPFGVRPKTVRLPGDEDKPTRKGYRRDWFETAWERYVPNPPDDSDDDA